MVTYPHKSTARSTAARGVPRPVPRPTAYHRERSRDALPVLPAHRLQGAGLAGGRGRRQHPPAAPVPGLRATVHHARADAARGGQAQRRGRAVQPRQGDQRRAQGLQGPAGHRGPARPARPAGGGLAPGLRSAGGARPTRSASPSSDRCGSWTRWPTCASPASTGSSRSVDDFEAEIALLRVEQEPTGIEPLIPDRVADSQGQHLHPAQADSGPADPPSPPDRARRNGPHDPGPGPRSRGRLARVRPGPHDRPTATASSSANITERRLTPASRVSARATTKGRQ